MAVPVLAYITDSSGPQLVDFASLAIAVLLYFLCAFVWPGIVARPLWWVITHSIYRSRVYGKQNIPPNGPALLVCNHVSYVDWMLIWAACPRRIRRHRRHPAERRLG